MAGYCKCLGNHIHQLIEKITLNRYHVPDSFRYFIVDDDFILTISVTSTTLDWHKLETGIITGCIISETFCNDHVKVSRRPMWATEN